MSEKKYISKTARLGSKIHRCYLGIKLINKTSASLLI